MRNIIIATQLIGGIASLILLIEGIKQYNISKADKITSKLLAMRI